MNWQWTAMIVYTLLVIAGCAYLIKKAIRGNMKPPPGPHPMLSDLQMKYIHDGKPDDFYIPDSWFEHVVTAIYTPPGSTLPEIPRKDEKGWYIDYHDSRMRPESSRWAKADG